MKNKRDVSLWTLNYRKWNFIHENQSLDLENKQRHERNIKVKAGQELQTWEANALKLMIGPARYKGAYTK